MDKQIVEKVRDIEDLKKFINTKDIKVLFILPIDGSLGFSHYEVIYKRLNKNGK